MRPTPSSLPRWTEASEGMSLKKIFLSRAATVRYLCHSDVKVTNTTTIANKNNDCVYGELRDELKPPRPWLGDWRRTMTIPSISCDCADACGWALENWLAICGMVLHGSHSESQGLERILGHGTTDLPCIQSRFLPRQWSSPTKVN